MTTTVTGSREQARQSWKVEKVLVPLDGSSESERILLWVEALAQKTGASLTLLAVMEKPGGSEYINQYPPVAQTAAFSVRESIAASVERAERRAHGYLETVARRLSGVRSTRTEVAFGDAGEQIAGVATRIGADMIAMASRRESALARGVLGSSTARVIELKAAPTLVVRVDEQNPAPLGTWPQNIVVPLDVSALSETAVDPAITLALDTGARLRFLRVTPRVYYPGIWGDPASAGAPVYFSTDLRQGALEYLAPIVQRAIDAGVDAFPDVRSGDPAGNIVDALHELPGTMAVMCTHGRHGVQRWALGSVTDKVIRSSAVPVLALPAGSEE